MLSKESNKVTKSAGSAIRGIFDNLRSLIDYVNKALLEGQVLALHKVIENNSTKINSNKSNLMNDLNMANTSSFQFCLLPLLPRLP